MAKGNILTGKPAKRLLKEQEQQQPSSRVSLPVPREFQEGRIRLPAPARPLPEAHCWKEDFEEENYQAVLHYYSYLPAEHTGTIEDPNGYEAKCMSPEAATLYRQHRAFWEARHEEARSLRKKRTAERRQRTQESLAMAAQAGGLSKAELKAKLTRLSQLAEQDLTLAAELVANSPDPWLFEALLAGASIDQDGTLKPGTELKRFRQHSHTLMLLCLAQMPEGSRVDASLRRDARMTLEVTPENLGVLDVLADRLPGLRPSNVHVYGCERELRLSPAAAGLLIRSEEGLELEGLQSLTDDVAAILARHQGDLNLSGLASLSEGTAKALGQREGKLSLNGLKNLNDAAAKALARHRGHLWLRGLTSLPDAPGHLALAAKLARRGGEVDLDGLTKLGEEAAEALAKHRGLLRLNGLTSLSDAIATRLAKHQGGLHLNGLQKLSDSAAAALAKLKGSLSLDGLTSLSDAAAEAMAWHEGTLSLGGLTDVSNAAAEALANHADSLCFSDEQVMAAIDEAHERLELGNPAGEEESP